MATLNFKGSYGSSVTLVNARTADLFPETAIPSQLIAALSAYARIYVSTTASPYMYEYHVTINGGRRPDDYSTVEGQIDQYQLASPSTPGYVSLVGNLMNKLLTKGNVNLMTRPQVPASRLEEAGWTDAGDGTATVFSVTYSAGSDGVYFPNDILLHMTPIKADGSVLSPDALDAYVDSVLSGGTIVQALDVDKPANGGNGLILWAQPVLNGWSAGWTEADLFDATLHDMQAAYYLSDFSEMPTTGTLRHYLEDYTTPVTYTGTGTYKFSSVDTPTYVNIPISFTAQDPNFPTKKIESISVVEVNHPSSTRIRGTVRVYVEYGYIGAATAPSNLRINSQTAINLQAGTTAQLTWSAGAAGVYDTFLYYGVYQYTVETGQYLLLTTTTALSYTVTAPYTDGKSYYYYVETVCQYNKARQYNNVSIYTFIPLTAPTALNLNYIRPNPRPMLLVTLGEGPEDEYLTLIADGWTPSRRGLPGDHIYMIRNAPYDGATDEHITVTQTDERVRTVSTEWTVFYSPQTYTNEEIIAGESIVYAADITELQNALLRARIRYGMDGYHFTPCIAGSTQLTLWPTHISELHACIKEVQNFINAWDTSSPTYAIILPAFITSSGPSAAVMQQIRQIVTML